MTLSSQTNKITYIGNGVATEFAIPFYFLSESHLKVYQLLNDIQTTLTNYSVQGVKNINGGTIIFDTAPASGAEILIIRDVPMTQETDYQDNQVFHANTLEQGLDKLTMQVQQLSERIDRAVTVDVFSEQNGSDLLPSIKQSVSIAAQYATTATEQAELATDKAEIALSKASEVTEVISSFVENQEYILESLEQIKNGTFFDVEGKENIAELSFPSSVYETLTAVNNQEYIAPADGFYYIETFNANSSAFFSFTDGHCEQILGNTTAAGRGKILVSKGETFTLTFTTSISSFRFYYAKGNS